MQKLVKDTKERYLGRNIHKCRICQEKGNFKTYLVREMMYGTRDEFEYFECENCGCLQIAYIPDNLGDYYHEDYYSYKSIVEDGDNIIFTNDVKNTQRILDVGCGTGIRLLNLAIAGYNQLYGCDPYILQDIKYGDRVTIRKCDIHAIDDSIGFDRITMYDSFEHVTDPIEVLSSARELLKEDGLLEIHIPTYPNIAFDLFGPHWFQLDAPRHITLHSVKSIHIIAELNRMQIVKLQYDSGIAQIIRSFFYQHGISFFDMTEELQNLYFTPEMKSEINELTEKCNTDGRSDHMVVFMKKYESNEK